MNTPEWPDAGDRRSEERRHLLFATTAIGADGESQPVLVRDISARGLLLETEEAGSLDKTVIVNLPETGDIEAHIIWQGDKLAGCRLETHLSQATIDAVRAKGDAAHAEHPSTEASAAPRTAARTLAARLKQLRMAKDLTRAELAERSGISTPSIWAWETGRTVPRLGSLETLAKGLGVTVSELQIGVAGASGESLAALLPSVAAGDGAGDLRTARLAELVAASKAQIAAMAGTTADKVTISITL